jgi:hypothetical protein
LFSLLTTRDTVISETPALAATSRTVGRFNATLLASVAPSILASPT